MSFIALAVSLVIFLAVLCFFMHWDLKNARRQTEKENQRERESKEHEILRNLEIRLESTFGVRLDTVQESTTQDEIVRVVNLLAVRTAMSCVHEDVSHRGEKYEGVYRADLGETVSSLKRDWAKARKIALEIVPELIDRLPHFSEFEPLKSYNAEHLRKKVEKRATM